MNKGYFSGRKAPALSESEITARGNFLMQAAQELAEFCVKRKFNDYGVYKESDNDGATICFCAYDNEIHWKYDSWAAAAADGWQID
ncbi:hypothetical protein MED193_18994 [Roseobacter sp. MED193]|uniref:hypothetical protein n=1 Tax=Roseobacter sp. MED193 TaxID=314262 RepID=UPI000068B728|nr:hypothetical protein [Roseobacter sp. MED193]EAQ47310.1 hypothetical protein MED193_18994 [Roseobacter sp. MED193]